MLLDGSEDGLVLWKPAEIGEHRGGTEVYQAGGIELCVGDRIRWTHNDGGLCLVNSQSAEVTAANGGPVMFRLEDGRTLDMNAGGPQLRHIDRAGPRPCTRSRGGRSIT